MGAYAKNAEVKKGEDYEHVYEGWSDKDEYSWLHRIEVIFESPKLEANDDKLPEIKQASNCENNEDKNNDSKEKESE